MADEKVVVTYETDYDGTGAKTAQADLKKTASEAEKTGTATAKAGETGAEGFKTMAAGIGKAVAALAAIKGVIDFFAESVEAANQNARSANMLAAAYEKVGYNAQGAMQQAQKFASEMQSLTGIADEAFLDGQRLLANYGVVGAKAQEAIRAAYALSVSQGVSFESSLTQIAKAAAGSTASLSRYGIVLEEGLKSGEKFDAVLSQINERFGASAQATMGDAITKTSALKEAWGDFKEEVGGGLNTVVVPALDLLTKGVQILIQTFRSLSAAWGVTFDNIFTGIEYVKGGFLALATAAVNRLTPIVKVVSYLPGVGKDIETAFNGAKDSLAQMRDTTLEQASALADMRTPLSAIWETEKDITAEQQARLEAQAEEINNRLANEQVAQEELTEIVRQGVEERAQIVDEAQQAEQQKQNDLFGLKSLLNKQETKDKQKTFADITNMLRSGSKEQMAVQKAQGMAQAAISAYQAANSAYAALAPIPIVGPALGAAAAAAAIAYGLNNVAQISGIKLAEGGLVKAVTGGVPAIIGEGGSDEAVLPLNDSTAMRRIGGAIAEESGSVGGVVVNINVQAVGGVEAILEQLTDASRSGVVQALEFANLNYKVGAEQQGLSV